MDNELKVLTDDAVWSSETRAKGTGFDESMLDLPLDAGIRKAVLILNAAGIETYESCEGSEGHSYTEPTVRFFGEPEAGFRALAIALTYGLPVMKIGRIWTIQDGEPHGPYWEMVFWKTLD